MVRSFFLEKRERLIKSVFLKIKLGVYIERFGRYMVQKKIKERRNWIPRPCDPKMIAMLSRKTHIPPVLVQILWGRGFDDAEKMLLFLAPVNLKRDLRPPEDLPGCSVSAAKIAAAIRDKKKITIYGDYDTDGMTATAILTKVIQKLDGIVNYYIPNRLHEGYGLNCQAFHKLKEDGTQMIVSVDCGITSFEEALCAKELGIDLIISDHHTPVTEPGTDTLVLPEALAITHPRVDFETKSFVDYPCPYLCGAAVALKLAWLIARLVEGKDLVSLEVRRLLIHSVGLAALGTVADVVPLQDENRNIVRFALGNSLLNDPPMGLRYLAELAGVGNGKPFTSEDIGFMIAPRLNACGREVLHATSEKDNDDEENWKVAKALLQIPNRLAVTGQMGLGRLGVELLITEQQSRARELAPFINNLNDTRQKIERKIMQEALRQIELDYKDDPAFVLASRDWHPGVLGIVAGRLTELYFRPVVMIALKNCDPGTGSGRNVSGSSFNLYQAFESCSEYLERFGGHAAAAGLGIKETNIAAFRAAFCDYVAEHLSEADKIPKVYIDAELPLSVVTNQNVFAIDDMAPFGCENQRPIFVAYHVAMTEPAKRIGKKTKVHINGEIKEMVGQTFYAKFRQFQTERRAVAFGAGDWVEEMNELVLADSNIRFDIAFQMVFNEYLKQSEIRLIDWRVAEENQGSN